MTLLGIALVTIGIVAAIYFLPSREAEYKAAAKKQELGRMIGDKLPLH